MTPVLTDSLRKHALPILCLSLVPIIVAVIHDDWLYTPIGYLDPWYNVGYFLNYFDPNFMPGFYKESRLSWLAPGVLIYKMFSPLAANYILHLGCLISASVLVYLTLARLVSRNAAFIAAALLCAYCPFHNSGGWDYQTTPSGAYYALTLYLLTRAAQSMRPGAWLVAAGAAFAATFHADILFVNMSLGLAAHYLVITRRERSVKELAIAAGWGLLGFIMVTQALAMVALSAGRSAMFYKPIVDIVFNYTLDPHAHMGFWWLPTASLWFLKAPSAAYLLPLAGTALAGIVALIGFALKLRRRDPARDTQTAIALPMVMIGQFVFLFLLWCVWQSVGHVALQPDYFAYPLIVPAFIALGALIGPATRRELILLGVALVAVAASSLIGPARVPLWDVPVAYGTLVAAILAAIAAGALRPGVRPVATVLAAAVFLFAYPAMWPNSMWSQLRPLPGDCGNPRQLFSELTRVNVLLLRNRPAKEKTWLWNGPFTPADSMCTVPLDEFRWALVSSGVTPLAPGAQVKAGDLKENDVLTAAVGDRVVVIAREETEFAPLEARFAQSKRTLAVEHKEPLKFDRRWVYMTIYRVKS